MYLIPRHDICMSDPMPFNQHWDARVPVPIADVGDVGKALHSAFASLRPGDRVDIASFADRAWTNAVEFATFRVTSLDDDVIKVIQIGDTVKVPKAKPASAKPADDQLEVVTVKGGAFEVRDGKGNTLETFVSRKQAEDFKRQSSGSAAAA